MATAIFERVVAEVKTLPPEEQRLLWELLNTLRDVWDERTKLDALEQQLLADGTITRIPPPITDLTPYLNRKPVGITGKPLSETIIKERG